MEQNELRKNRGQRADTDRNFLNDRSLQEQESGSPVCTTDMGALGGRQIAPEEMEDDF